MLDDRLLIETPENIDVAYDVAGIGSRFIAALIDHILIGFVFSVCVLAFNALLTSLSDGIDESIGIGIAGIGLYLLLCAYYTFFETLWNGQTPGKRILGLRVVRPGGRPIGFLGSATRNIVRLADFLPMIYGIGIAAMFLDRRARRLGDLAAGALTIKERRTLTLDALVARKPLIGGPQAESLTIPNLEAISLDDYRLLQEYLAQRTMISFESRRRLAVQLLFGLQQRLGYPVYGDPEAFMLRLVAEYNALHETQQTPPAPPAPSIPPFAS